MKELKSWLFAAGFGLTAFSSWSQVIPVDNFGALNDAFGYGDVGVSQTFGQNNGWTVTGGTVDIIGSLWQSPDGLASLDMDGNNPGAIATTINVPTAGAVTVDFYFAGNPGGVNPKLLDVQLGSDAAQEYNFNYSGDTTENMGWITESAVFDISNPGDLTLSFASLDPSDSDQGPALGTVTASEVAFVSGVPDGGSSFLFLALSGAGLIYLRRRIAHSA